MKQAIGLLALLLLSACGGPARETVTVNPFSIERETHQGTHAYRQDHDDAHDGGYDAAHAEAHGADHQAAHSPSAGAHGPERREVANQFWNRPTSYTLPDPTPAPQVPTLSYGGGDSSSGRVIHSVAGNSLSFNAATPSEVEAAPQAQAADADAVPQAEAQAAPPVEADLEADVAEAPEAERDTEMAEGELDAEAEMAEADMPDADAEMAEVEAPMAEAPAAFDWQQLGETTYIQNCSACHQANGQGIPGAFPPLAGHVPNLYNAEGGREYLIKVVLYGLQGQIVVNGMTYNGAMNPWGHLSNEQIAAALNHELTSWGNDQLLTDFKPIMPDEVEALRGLGLAPTQVLEARPNIGN